jgi:hypothetical protein
MFRLPDVIINCRECTDAPGTPSNQNGPAPVAIDAGRPAQVAGYAARPFPLSEICFSPTFTLICFGFASARLARVIFNTPFS